MDFVCATTRRYSPTLFTQTTIISLFFKDAEWNAFQKTLMFDNLDSSLPTNVKKRGGKAARKRREREAELLKKDERNLIDVSVSC